MKPFPTVIMMIFLGLALFGVVIFATFTAATRDQIGTVQIWGSLPEETMGEVLRYVKDKREDFTDVTYQEYPPETLVPSVIDAIAANRGPDLVLLPNAAIVRDEEKFMLMPYDWVSRRDFQDAFVEAGEAYLLDDGVLGLPFTIDPIVMYWNRTLFANAGVSNPPRYWDELAKMAPLLTTKTPNGSLTVSAVPLGLWANVAHAKAVLVTLSTQLGNPIVTRGTGGYRLSLESSDAEGVSPFLSAVRFVTDFADPVKPMYSWNRSQKNSRDAFLAGTLALYFAPASELVSLREANPNLNFDVALVPQSRGAGQAIGAAVTALSIPRGSRNPEGAFTVATELVSPDTQVFVSTLVLLPSTRRDVALDASADQYLAVFQSAALRSFSFLDPAPTETDALFSRMIESIASGARTQAEAVRIAHDDLQALIRVR